VEENGKHEPEPEQELTSATEESNGNGEAPAEKESNGDAEAPAEKESNGDAEAPAEKDSNGDAEAPAEGKPEVNGAEQATTPVDAQPQEAPQESEASSANGASEEHQSGSQQPEPAVTKDIINIEGTAKIEASDQQQGDSTAAVNGSNGESASA